MCLDLKNERTRVKTAKEDIVVYKALRPIYGNVIINKLHKLKHGDSFTGVIRGIECEGKISIDDGRIFFCTNNKNLDGYSANDKLGYKYNWLIDGVVRKIIVNDSIIYEIEAIGYTTYYQKFEVKMGETYTSDLEKISDSIEKGLHTFKTMKDAKLYSGTVAKCIIPKGSRYYEGIFFCVVSSVSYASDTLTYVEIVK